MRVRVEFTVDIPVGDLPRMRELASAGDNHRTSCCLCAPKHEHVITYLTDNGVRATVRRELL